MKEKLLDFENSKLAKDKGFNLSCPWYYYDEPSDKVLGIIRGKLTYNTASSNDMIYIKENKHVYAPELTVVQKWLLEEHNLWVEVTLWEHGWNCMIKEIREDGVYNKEQVNVGHNDKRNQEQFLEAGILLALNLISAKKEL